MTIFRMYGIVMNASVKIDAFSGWHSSNADCLLPGDYILKWKRKQWDILGTSMPHMFEMLGYWYKVFYDDFQTTEFCIHFLHDNASIDIWRCIQNSQTHC
jgi:hypothetical protein